MTTPSAPDLLPEIRPGLRFLHRRWLNTALTFEELNNPEIPAEKKAQLMEVTTVRDGAIYYGWVTPSGNVGTQREFARSEERFRHNVLKYILPPSN